LSYVGMRLDYYFFITSLQSYQIIYSYLNCLDNVFNVCSNPVALSIKNH